jgi:hypothetical protein
VEALIQLHIHHYVQKHIQKMAMANFNHSKRQNCQVLFSLTINISMQQKHDRNTYSEFIFNLSN